MSGQILVEEILEQRIFSGRSRLWKISNGWEFGWEDLGWCRSRFGKISVDGTLVLCWDRMVSKFGSVNDTLLLYSDIKIYKCGTVHDTLVLHLDTKGNTFCKIHETRVLCWETHVLKFNDVNATLVLLPDTNIFKFAKVDQTLDLRSHTKNNTSIKLNINHIQIICMVRVLHRFMFLSSN